MFPGPISQRMIQELRRYVRVEPHPFVIDLDRSRGMYLATADGQMVFDWAAYYGSKLLGHNHPGLEETGYLKRLARAANNKVSNPDFLTAECLDYYRLLYEKAPRCMKRPGLEVYAVNSGAEAVENMMKYLLVLHGEKAQARGDMPAVRRFLYFDHAFHGRTVFALNITQVSHDPVVTKGFQGIVPGNVQVKFPSVDTGQPDGRNDSRTDYCLEAVEDCLRQYQGEIVAIVVEPIQGAGGHRVAQPRFFQELSRLAHQYDTFLAFDEVQTAGGQTGALFMCDQLELPYPPQAVAVAKKFGNGAVFMLETLGDRGVLDSTWGGNLADMVRACREFEIVEQQGLIAQVPAKAALLVEGLNGLARKHPDTIFNVRGMGLYQGFSLRKPDHKKQLINVALETEQMLLLGAGAQSIRLRPVLDVTGEEISLMLEKLERCLSLLDVPARAPSGTA
jgi:L-lysine 6-transaminase